MKVLINIDLTHAEYDTLPEYEVARILRSLADTAEDHGLNINRTATDSRGVTVAVLEVVSL